MPEAPIPPLGAPAANDAQKRLRQYIDEGVRAHPPAESAGDSIGVTMFDQPGSEDATITVLLARDKAQQAPAQALDAQKTEDPTNMVIDIE